MAKSAKVIVISSVSGGGKTTVINMLRESHPHLSCAITATTRGPRKGEKEGKDYYFYSREEFEKQIQEEKLLEYAQVYGHYYGLPAKPVLEKLKQGLSVILNIDVQGLRTIRKKLDSKQILSFFLLPPNAKTWEKRLRQRRTDTEEQIQRRLKQGRLEIQEAKGYDHSIVNDNLAKTMEKFTHILKQGGLIP